VKSSRTAPAAEALDPRATLTAIRTSAAHLAGALIPLASPPNGVDPVAWHGAVTAMTRRTTSFLKRLADDADALEELVNDASPSARVYDLAEYRRRRLDPRGEYATVPPKPTGGA
jgi:hypothetical protein